MTACICDKREQAGFREENNFKPGRTSISLHLTSVFCFGVIRQLKQRRFLSDGSQPELRPYPFLSALTLTNKHCSVFSLIKTIYQRVSTKPLPNDAKSPLPVDVRYSKTLLIKLPIEV